MNIKPGCFGSPLCHSNINLPCTLCPYTAECGERAQVVAKELAASYGIKEALTYVMAKNRVTPRARKNSGKRLAANDKPLILPETQPNESSGLSQKAEDLLRKLLSRGIDLKRSVQMNVNPFVNSAPRFMKVAMQMLLDDGFTRAELREAFMKHLKWNRQSAAAHVSFTIPVLLHTGAAIERSERIIRFND